MVFEFRKHKKFTRRQIRIARIRNHLKSQPCYTMDVISTLEFQVVPHSPRSLHLDPCKLFFIFLTLKEHLKGIQFQSKEEDQTEVK